MKTFEDFTKWINEKALKDDDIDDLIKRAREAVQNVISDKSKKTAEVNKAKGVMKFIDDVNDTWKKDNKLHPNAVNGLSRIVAGVGSGRFGWASGEADGSVPSNYSR